MYAYRTLEAWKRAHQVALHVMQATDMPTHPRVRSLFDQIRRAVVSIEANIVEGYALGTPALCRRHLRIAMGSAAEAECLMRMAGELGYLPATLVKVSEGKLGDTMRALHGLLRNPPTHRI
jgi:four helix bundle protein